MKKHIYALLLNDVGEECLGDGFRNVGVRERNEVAILAEAIHD